MVLQQLLAITQIENVCYFFLLQMCYKTKSSSFLKNPSCNLHVNCKVSGILLLLLFNSFFLVGISEVAHGNVHFNFGRVMPQRAFQWLLHIEL